MQEKEEENENANEEEKAEKPKAVKKAPKPLKGGENFCRINLKRGYKPRGQKSVSYKA